MKSSGSDIRRDALVRREAREGWVALQLPALSEAGFDQVEELVTRLRVEDLDEQPSLPVDRSAPAVIKPPRVDYAFVMSDVDDTEGA